MRELPKQPYIIQPPPEVLALLQSLAAQGFEAFVVGGCVRDSLLGRAPADWDIATAALPQQVMRCFDGQYELFSPGLKFGTVTVAAGELRCEVTTYRSDGPSSDYRRPQQVRFTALLQEDLARRDFTINAMAWNPARGLQDPYGGLADLRAGVIRCVGDPQSRFREDALRIFRCARFAAVLGFEIEAQTRAGMLELCDLLQHIAAERLQAELCKALMGEAFAAVFLQNHAVITAVIPELAPMVGFAQNNPHHIYDVWEHTLRAVQAAAPVLPVRLALLLHDIGKPAVYWADPQGVGHFCEHPQVGANMSKEILRRLRFDNATVALVQKLVRYHALYTDPSPADIRRWLHRLGEETFRLLLLVCRADTAAKSPQTAQQGAAHLNRMEQLLDAVLAEAPCVTLAGLAVDGRDLMALGVPKGPQVGAWLRMLLEQVLAGAPNDREAMLRQLASWLAAGEEPNIPPERLL